MRKALFSLVEIAPNIVVLDSLAIHLNIILDDFLFFLISSFTIYGLLFMDYVLIPISDIFSISTADYDRHPAT